MSLLLIITIFIMIILYWYNISTYKLGYYILCNGLQCYCNGLQLYFIFYFNSVLEISYTTILIYLNICTELVYTLYCLQYLFI